MHKLIFTLQQHTPLIHFQPDQQGATLRASEVKPKLDRFIIEKLGGTDEVRKQHPEWFISKESSALKYKLRLNNTGTNTQQTILKLNKKNDKYESKYPMILANMGGSKNIEELRDLVQFESIIGAIISNVKELTKIIAESVSVFFANNNFGNRCTKGFGSYSVLNYQIGNDDAIITNWNETEYFPKGTFYLKIDSNKSKDIYAVIDYYWKRLKSGINYSYDKNTNECTAQLHPERYHKSYLFKYLDNNLNSKYIWEKRKVKRELFNKTIPPSKKDERFARATLGLSDKFTYARTFENCNPDYPKTNIKTNIDINITHNEETESKKIDRIPSPITFKPVKFGNEYNVYILIDNNTYPIYDKEFKLELADFTLNYSKIDGKSTKVRAGSNIVDLDNQLKIHRESVNCDTNKRSQETDLIYFLSLPPSCILRTPVESINLKELILKYNTNELSSSFMPINFKGESLLAKNVTIHKM